MFVTWQPVLTDHQAFTYEQLSRQAKIPVLAYVLAMEDETRRSQGWSDTQVESIERRLIPERGALSYCYEKMREHRHDVHFFGSPFQNLKMLYCWMLAVCLGVEFYIISEPYSPIAQGYFSDRSLSAERIKASLRPYIYKLYVLLLRRRMAGVFAISRRAVSQYAEAGVPTGKLFPFGYFVPAVEVISEPRRDVLAASSPLRVVFVGALIGRKGLDQLIGAIRALSFPVELDIYGPGDPELFDVDGRTVQYRGSIPFGETQAVVGAYDLLILPSRYDGWGVVVNEALCAGIPVVCSDQVGASTLVERFGAGAVFHSTEPKALEHLLAELGRDPERLLAMRLATRSAAEAIQPGVAAAYMLAVLRSEPSDRASIPSPWYVE
ncbi:glycosyltransferase family 4 protein [Pseudomonas gingeri]|uniref:Glycosyltransferase family 4 protein n=1 Tax=Pseudomonas gingeri TaxID=117681 RepID=A0A7Y8C2T4_9PSED|nr:glycosyltransferase family 4 protein [Pseudomonas gingeri]NWB97830.1 glycosyltransferase family 4 protein [Pseudomonas gingeri]